MIRQVSLSLVLWMVSFSAVSAGIIERAESTALKRSSGEVVPRVERDEEGHVIWLLLSGMQLSQEEIKEVSKLEHLRRLVLFRTNITDRDVAQLTRCRKLEHLNLTSTEVTDAAVDSILKFEHLETLCLGDVRIYQEGAEKIREYNRQHDNRIRWGYTPRKPERKDQP